MKTLLTACLISLVFALNSLAQSPAPPRTSPPGAPPVASPGAPAAASPGAPAAVSPGAPGAVNPAAPAQLPAQSVPPGGPVAPGATITATLSPAPATAGSPAPAAEQKPSGGLVGTNWLIDNFRKGGPITGLIRSFSFLGNEELAVQAVTGGIAEALIATACGLGIAIFSLIPFNFFNSRVSNLEFELQTAATNLEVMLGAQSAEREMEIAGAAPASGKGASI